MPSGVKPVVRTLASGDVRTYHYHRATGVRLLQNPTSAEGLLEIAALDRRALRLNATAQAAPGTFAALWLAYRGDPTIAGDKGSPEWRALKPRTRSDYQKVRDWIGDAAAKMIVKALTPGDILKLRDKAAAAKGRRFGTYALQVVRLVLEWGKDRDWRPDNPAMGLKAIRKPKGDAEVNRAWSPAEIEAFSRAAPPQLMIPFLLGLFAGMRQGDALIVTWAAYDGSALRWIAGKNDEHCIAPVTGKFKEVLDRAKAKRGSTVQIALNSAGSPWTQSGFRASFFKLIKKLEAKKTVRPGCTFHGLRHTIATTARDGGETSEWRIAAAIGDRSTDMAAVYGRDADRERAQMAVLTDVQKRLGNNLMENDLENGSKRSGFDHPENSLKPE
jgi:integrase